MADFGKINLAALKHKVAVFEKKGTTEKIECVVIPIKENHLFKSDKGNIFMDVVAFEMKEPQKDNDGAVISTHIVKQSLPKEVRASMTEQEKKEQPILGNLAIYKSNFTGEKPAVQDTSIGESDGDDDLPF